MTSTFTPYPWETVYSPGNPAKSKYPSPEELQAAEEAFAAWVEENAGGGVGPWQATTHRAEGVTSTVEARLEGTDVVRLRGVFTLATGHELHEGEAVFILPDDLKPSVERFTVIGAGGEEGNLHSIRIATNGEVFLRSGEELAGPTASSFDGVTFTL